MNVRSTDRLEVSETQEEQAPGGSEQGILSLEGRRLRGNTRAAVKYEKEHCVEEVSGVLGLL